MTARLDTVAAQALTLRYFGIEGIATELGGERTQNFRIRTASRSSFTLKVSDPQERVEGMLLESAALLHIARVAPHIPVPRLVQAADGSLAVFLGAEDRRYLRLLTYLEGTPLSLVPAPSGALRATVGHAVARLDAALADFDHAFARRRQLIWDVSNISQLRPHLTLIDAQRRPLAEAMLSRFEAAAAPALAELPAQAVHSDMNGQNILIRDDGQAGFLDFGDLVHAPRLVDLAGIALLQMQGNGSDLLHAGDVVAAYDGVLPLTDPEIRLLPEFMIGRCVINVLATAFLADRNPANRVYIMKNNPASWQRLEQLSSLPQNPFRKPH